MAFVRKKRVGAYEYYQLVENLWVDGQPRQKVLLHLGTYPTTVEVALEEWPQAIERLLRYAEKQQQEAERLGENSPPPTMSDTLLRRAQKAHRRANALAAKLRVLHDLRDQGKV
jgi:hypothetical protein